MSARRERVVPPEIPQAEAPAAESFSDTTPESDLPAADLFTSPEGAGPSETKAAAAALADALAQVELTREAEAAERAHLRAHVDALATQFAEKLEIYREEMATKLAAISQYIESMETAVRAKFDTIPAASNTGLELAALKGIVARMADAIDRQDLVTPPATAAQVEDALAKGPCRLRVLKRYQAMGFTAEVGRELDSQTVNHGTVLDGVRSGRLLVSIMPPART